MVPSSVEKITVAGALLPLWLMTKSLVVLKTLPLGAAGGVTPGGVGMVIGEPTTRPEALYSVATPAWLSATRNWPSGVCERPQGFWRLGSVVGARPGMSEARLVCTKEPPGSGLKKAWSMNPATDRPWASPVVTSKRKWFPLQTTLFSASVAAAEKLGNACVSPFKSSDVRLELMLSVPKKSASVDAAAPLMPPCAET